MEPGGICLELNTYTSGDYIMCLRHTTYRFTVHKSTFKSHIHPSQGRGEDSINTPHTVSVTGRAL